VMFLPFDYEADSQTGVGGYAKNPQRYTDV